MHVCMITEQDKKIGLSSPTRTGFASFAQSIAVFTMSVSALPLHVWLSNPPSPICCLVCRETLFIPLVRQESFLLQTQGCLFRDVDSWGSTTTCYSYMCNVFYGRPISITIEHNINALFATIGRSRTQTDIADKWASHI